MIYEFGEFDLDLRQFQLRRGSEPVSVEPKVFDVLRYLVEHRDRVVPKAELLAKVWPNDVVTDAVLPNNVAVLRKALGQTRREKAPIETIHGRGYRFSAQVTIRADSGASAVPGVGIGEAGGRDPFVARDTVVERLRALRAAATGGRGRICVVYGAAGMGKTRLLDELRADGAPAIAVHAARCLPRAGPDDGVPALWPWIQLLRSCAAELPRELDDAAPVPGQDVLPALLPAFGAPSLASAPPDFSVLDGLVRFFVGAAQRRPRVLLIDDLHLADAESVQVLGLLAQEILAARMLVVVALRDGQLPIGDPTREALVALSRPRGVERITLTALGPHDVEEYVHAALGVELPQELPQRVFELTLGTPMYVRDVVEGMMDTAGGFDAERYRDHGVTLSQAAYDYARQRVARLATPIVEALRAAAVIGERFRLQVLSRLLPGAGHELLDRMDAACSAGIIEPDTALADGYIFAHPFLRAAIYDGLSAGFRVRTHRSVADALAEGAVEYDHLVLSAIAEHYHRSLPGHDPELAIEYACRAGRDATYAQEYTLAVRMYGLALEAVAFAPGSNPARRARILRWLVRSNIDAGQMREARYLSTELLEMTRRHGLHEEFAAAVQVIASQERYDAGRGTYPVQLMDEALSHLPRESGYRPRLLVERARSRELTRERRAELLDEAQSLMGGDIPTALECQSARVEVLTGPDTIDGLLEVADAAVACWPRQAVELDLLVDPVARRASLRALWIVRYTVQRARCFALMTRGDVAEADRAADACREVADRSGWPLARFECGLYRIGRLIAEGDLQAAERAIDEVHGMGKTLQRMEGSVALLALREQLRAVAGQPPTVSEKLLASVSRELPGVRGETLIGTAFLATRCGFTALGERIFESFVRDGFRGVPRGTPRLSALCELAYVCASIGGATLANAALVELLEPHVDLCAVSRTGIIAGPVDIALSLLHRGAGRHEEAVTHARAGLTKARAMGFATPAVQAGIVLGRALLSRAGEEDHAAAVAELAVAERLAVRNGLTGLAAEARAVVEPTSGEAHADA